VVRVHYNNRLDIYTIDNIRVGIFREPFDRVRELNGFLIQPVEGNPVCWDFTLDESGQRGRMLDVPGLLHGDHVTLSAGGLAYLITRQGFTLALLFPKGPRRVKLNQVRFRNVEEGKYEYPAAWPREMISRVIRYRFKNVVLINEAFLLAQIGMRT